MPVNPDSLNEIMLAVTKRFGETSIRMGDQVPPVRSISWGSIEMDLATWGGAPMGRMVRPWGAGHSGKSLASWGLTREAQKQGLKIAYYNVEQQYDPVFTRDKMGVDIDDLIVVEGSLIEEVGVKLQALLGAANIHIIDSVSMGISRQEFDTPHDKYSPRGARARAWGEILRDVTERMDDQENMIVLIDQVRVNQQHGGEQAASSTIFHHASSMSLHHKKIRNLYRDASGELQEKYPKTSHVETMGGEILVDGMELGIECVKSRVCRPFGKARLRLNLETMQFDRAYELAKAGEWLGVIEKNGAFFKVPTTDKAIHGGAKLRERLQEDDALVMQIYAAKKRHLERRVIG